MSQAKDVLRRAPFAGVAAVMLMVLTVLAAPPRQASAGALLDRSLQVSSNRASDETIIGAGGVAAAPGEASNGQKVSHTYSFTSPTVGDIKSFEIQYCDNPFGYLGIDGVAGAPACTVPTGFSAANAPDPVVEVNGAQDTTFTTTPVVGSTSYRIRFTNSTGVTTAATSDVITITFTADATDYFVNPNTLYRTNTQWGTYYAHIEAFSDDAYTALTDEGTVTNSVSDTITISTRVQETLKFSVGSAWTDPTTTCAALGGSGDLTMGDANQALSASQTYYAYSYFRLATNSASGAQVKYAGETLTSTAGDTIDEFGANRVASDDGNEQFGLAITDQDESTDPGGPFSTAMTDLEIDAEYDSTDGSDFYAFVSASNTIPVTIADSTGDVVSCDSAIVKYAANIANETEAGVYSTRIAYIAVPSY